MWQRGVLRKTPRTQDAVLACYYSGQVKVAEMPLDTCRMMQAIEWEDPATSACPIPVI